MKSREWGWGQVSRGPVIRAPRLEPRMERKLPQGMASLAGGRGVGGRGGLGTKWDARTMPDERSTAGLQPCAVPLCRLAPAFAQESLNPKRRESRSWSHCRHPRASCSLGWVATANSRLARLALKSEGLLSKLALRLLMPVKIWLSLGR